MKTAQQIEAEIKEKGLEKFLEDLEKNRVLDDPAHFFYHQPYQNTNALEAARQHIIALDTYVTMLTNDIEVLTNRMMEYEHTILEQGAYLQTLIGVLMAKKVIEKGEMDAGWAHVISEIKKAMKSKEALTDSQDDPGLSLEQ